MSKLFGLFGRKKKNKKQLSPTTQPQQSSHPQTTTPKSLPRNIDWREHYGSESRYSPAPRRHELSRDESLESIHSKEIHQIHRNETRLSNKYRDSKRFHQLNNSVLTESRDSNSHFPSQNAEIFLDNGNTMQLETSEMENFTSGAKESLLLQTGATRNTSTPHMTEIEPERYVMLREKYGQGQSRILGEYVDVAPCGSEPPDMTDENECELRLHQNDNERKLSMGLKNEIGKNRLSLIENLEQPGVAIPPGRVSLLIPLTLDGQDPELRKSTRIVGPMERFVPDVQPRKLSLVRPVAQVEEGVGQIRFSVLSRKDMKPTRQSVMRQSTRRQSIVEVEPNKYARLSTVNPIVINQNTQSGRVSVIRPLSGAERFPLNSTQQPLIYMVRGSINEPVTRQSLCLNRPFTRKRDEGQDGRGLGGIREEQTVYAVPKVPTRGRATSILQQSVKTLTSQKEQSPVSRKNIRYSVDTDVFSADVKRRYANPQAPGYVNMERGQPMLVSELLNPITSIFVTDLKDPVPKDPLSRPREANNWVRPRQHSMREVVTPQHAHKKPRVQISVAPVTTSNKAQPKPVEKQQYNRYDSEESGSSSSGDSEESFESRSKYSTQRKQTHRVYAAALPTVNLPDIINRVDDTTFTNRNENVAQPSLDTNTVNGTQERRQSKLVQPPNVKRLSVAQETDIEDAVDFLCNPPEDIIKDAA